MKCLVLVRSEHILQPNVVQGANFSLTIMKLTAGLFLDTLVLVDGQFQLCKLFSIYGISLPSGRNSPLWDTRDDFIVTPGVVTALPQGNNVP